MADANTIIVRLGQQLAQLSVDKTILEVDLAEALTRIAALEGEQE